MGIDGTSPSKISGPGDDNFTETDLFLGKKALKLMQALCIFAFLACCGIAIFVFLNVPWETRMPYDGKFNRSGSGIPMQIAMIVSMVLLAGIWLAARKPDAHKMRKGARIGTYGLGTGLILLVVVIQWVMGISILRAGGFVLA